jgi:PmbA protein
MSRAIAFARLTTPDDSNVLPSDKGSADVDGLYDPGIARVSMDKKIDIALEVESLAMKDPKITHSSGSSFGEWEGEVFIANSKGISKSYKASICSVGVGVVAEKGDQRRTGGEWSSRRFFADLEPLDEIAASAARKAWELLDPRMVPTQRASVIFDASVAPSLLGGIITAINGERVLQGASFLQNSMMSNLLHHCLPLPMTAQYQKAPEVLPLTGKECQQLKECLSKTGY